MLLVRDVMTRGAITVAPDAPLKDAARELVQRGISGLVVVDASGVLRGVLSEADFLAKHATRGRIRRRPLAQLIGDSPQVRTDMARATARTVGQAMSTPAITIDADRPISHAASRMIERRIKRLPVMDNGRLVGIVTRSDLLRTFVVSDDRLAETIRVDLILRTFLLDPNQFEVVVSDGVVRLSGHVELRSMSADLERLAREVPGVVAVQAKVGWRVDDVSRHERVGWEASVLPR